MLEEEVATGFNTRIRKLSSLSPFPWIQGEGDIVNTTLFLKHTQKYQGSKVDINA